MTSAMSNARRRARESVSALFGLRRKVRIAVENGLRSLDDAEELLRREEPFIKKLKDEVTKPWTGKTWLDLGLHVAFVFIGIATSVIAVMMTMSEKITYDPVKAIVYGLSFVAATSFGLAYRYQRLKGRAQKRLETLLVRCGITAFVFATTAFFVEYTDWAKYADSTALSTDDLIAVVAGAADNAAFAGGRSVWWLDLPTLLPWAVVLTVAMMVMDLTLLAWMKIRIDHLFDTHGSPWYREKVRNLTYDERLAVVEAWRRETAELNGMLSTVEDLAKRAEDQIQETAKRADIASGLAFDRTVTKLQQLQRLQNEINTFLR